MASRTDVLPLTLASIAHRCSRETALFFQRQRHDPRFCFELFRRAIMDHDQHAWDLVYYQYRALVAGWVERHSAFPGSGEEVQYYVNRAFEKMWVAMTPEKLGHFSNLKSLLRYLQMCVHSAIIDRVWKAELHLVDIETAESAVWDTARDTLTGGQLLERVHRQEFWREVNARLKNDKERKVVYGSFVLALKPRELCARFQDTFRDVKDVYRVKDNVLARLGRDAGLRKLLSGRA